MSADLGSLLTALFSDPVYGLPLTIWIVGGIVWLVYGSGVNPPALLPYRASRVRSADPVSAMYWALQEQRYSEAIIFAYQRLAASFQRRYGISINAIPWRRKKRVRLGLEDPRPYDRILRKMVKALDTANLLERKPALLSWSVLRRKARQAKLQRRMAAVFADLDWMLPLLEGRA
jgi:hypothetical protein